MSPKNGKATGKHKSKGKTGEEVGADDENDEGLDEYIRDDVDGSDDNPPSKSNGLLKRGSKPKLTMLGSKEDISNSNDEANNSGSGGNRSRGSRRKTVKKLSKQTVIRHYNDQRREHYLGGRFFR